MPLIICRLQRLHQSPQSVVSQGYCCLNQALDPVFVYGVYTDFRKGNSFISNKRKIEIFSAGCSACDETIQTVKAIACPSCEVEVLDMNQPHIAARAKQLEVRSVPAVAIDGKLADCCAGRGVDEATLRAAGVG